MEACTLLQNPEANNTGIFFFIFKLKANFSNIKDSNNNLINGVVFPVLKFLKEPFFKTSSL